MVVIIIPSLQSGGTEWQTVFLVRALAARFAICIWIYDRQHIDPDLHRRLQEIVGLRIVFGGDFAGLRAVLRERPKIILSYAINYYLPEIALKLVSGAALITERRNLYHWMKTQRRARFQERIRNRLTTETLCNSESVAERVREFEPEVKNRIRVIYNAVSPMVRKCIAGKPAIIAVSNVKRGKGLEVVLQVFKVLRDEKIGDSVDFAIFGRLDEPGVFEGIDKAFLGEIYRGSAAQEEIYDSAIALLHLSESEGFPNAVVEAAAAGVIPILSDIPVHREIFSDCAIFVRGVDDAATATRELIRIWENDRSTFAQRVARCKALADRFSLSARVDQYESILLAYRH